MSTAAVAFGQKPRPRFGRSTPKIAVSAFHLQKALEDQTAKVSFLSSKKYELERDLSTSDARITAYARQVRELKGEVKRLSHELNAARHDYNDQVAMARVKEEEWSLRWEELLAQLQERAKTTRDQIDAIIERACKHFGVEAKAVLSNRRSKHISLPRMVIAYCLRNETTLSYPEIARVMGYADHTSALCACKRIDAILASGDLTLPEEWV